MPAAAARAKRGDPESQQEEEQESQQQQPTGEEGEGNNDNAPAAKKAKKAKAAEVVLVTQRDELPGKPALTPLAQGGNGLRILSYNVNGLKALVGKNGKLLSELAQAEGADVLLLQETKLQECYTGDYGDDLLPGYSGFWSCSKTKKGYAGTAAFVKSIYVDAAAQGSGGGKNGSNGNGGGAKQQKLTSFFGGKKKDEAAEKEEKEEDGKVLASVPASASAAVGLKLLRVTYGIDGDDLDEEGRTITLEFTNLFVVNVYVPNSGMKLEKLDYRLKTWNTAFQAYLKGLKARKPVVVAGDLNVAHLDIDIYNNGAKHLPKVPGCTPQEREAQTAWLASGWVDAFRHLHPTALGQYTYWNVKTNARPENKGLRLDYFIVGAEDVDGQRGVRVHDSGILHAATVGFSDHCPVALTLAVEADN